MYEDIVTIITNQMNTFVENEVVKAVQSVGVNVDKDELIKALQYDRGQYNKGYKDGVKALAERLQAKAFRFCGNDYRTILEDDLYTVLEEMGCE